MKKYQIVTLSLLFVLVASCSQDNEIKNELTEIKQLLKEINQKLGDSSTDDSEIERLAESYQSAMNFREEGADLEKLDKISLPENPSKDQVKEYLRKISMASANQRSYSESDPQVFMLAKIGNKNLELLLQTSLTHQVEFYAIPAIARLAQPKDKKLILKYLPFKKELVKVVIQKGWEEDAKPILYNELRQIPDYLPTEWIRAIANLQEQCIYKDLKQYLIYGSNKSWTYDAIKMLPGIELEDAVIQAWENVKREDQWSRNSFAPIALEYGQSDALSVIIDSLDSSPNDHNAVRSPRKYILQYTYASGSNNDMRTWYNKNKSNLYFDKGKMKYIVKD